MDITTGCFVAITANFISELNAVNKRPWRNVHSAVLRSALLVSVYMC